VVLGSVSGSNATAPATVVVINMERETVWPNTAALMTEKAKTLITLIRRKKKKEEGYTPSESNMFRIVPLACATLHLTR
jgi:hypothetical protein